MATFRNVGRKTAVFRIGGTPGTLPLEFSVAAGDCCEAPAGYATHLAQYGLSLVTDGALAPIPQPEPVAVPAPEPELVVAPTPVEAPAESVPPTSAGEGVMTRKGKRGR